MKLRGALYTLPVKPVPCELMELERFRQLMPNDLIDAHGLRKFGLSQVEFNLSGTSCIDFIKKVNDWYSLHHRQPYVGFRYLKTWSQDEDFTAMVPKGSPSVTVEGVVADSRFLSRGEQEARGLNLVVTSHLVAAHAAFLVLTGRDLFEGGIVRTKEGLLRFSHRLGLYSPAFPIFGFDPVRVVLDSRRADVFGSRYLEEFRFPSPKW